MKKLYVLLFLALPFVANAQFSKGNIFLGGTISAVLQNSDYNPSGTSTSLPTTVSVYLHRSAFFSMRRLLLEQQ